MCNVARMTRRRRMKQLLRMKMRKRWMILARWMKRMERVESMRIKLQEKRLPGRRRSKAIWNSNSILPTNCELRMRRHWRLTLPNLKVSRGFFFFSLFFWVIEIKLTIWGSADDVKSSRPNLNILAEYRKREAEFLDRARDLETVTNARDAAKARYDELRKVRLDEFMAGFTAITAKLKEMYQANLFFFWNSLIQRR